ncbi:MAG: 4-(cytidine 5'-diphospho)-2-C-methyl-D-erythritol kinase [Treponema sp.]|nr:4-(cytidine 5'-diphospho)-2-C-methyl-D-erythritol kinase [Treponema sp.]
MPRVKIEAPAKLNLHLQIGDRRPDGYHEIESLFLALAFGDTLSFETVHEPQVVEICMDWQPLCDAPAGFPAIPPEKNIIWRAVSLFRNRTGYEKGLKISVEKRIPPGGGLGGGSSDAAAALLALNRLAASDGKGLVSDAALAEMGASLGSDVPFFLCNAAGGAAWVSGRGEKVQPFDMPEPARGFSVVLVNPGFSSDTTEAYRLFSVWRSKNALISPQYSSFLLKFLSGPPQNWPFFNDFLTVFNTAAGESASMSEIYATYQHIISGLREQGADFAGLSGSGSTCFGVFSGREKAESARKNLLLHWPLVICTFLLAHPATPWYNGDIEEGADKNKESTSWRSPTLESVKW